MAINPPGAKVPRAFRSKVLDKRVEKVEKTFTEPKFREAFLEYVAQKAVKLTLRRLNVMKPNGVVWVRVVLEASGGMVLQSRLSPREGRELPPTPFNLEAGDRLIFTMMPEREIEEKVAAGRVRVVLAASAL